MGINESIVEDASLEWFRELGYAVGYGPHLAPGEYAKGTLTPTLCLRLSPLRSGSQGEGGKSNCPAVPKGSNFSVKGDDAMKKKPEPDSDLILYLTEDGRTRLQVRLEGETVWLSLGQMVDLFQRDKSVISRHIKNIFEEGELVRDSVVAESATTVADGKSWKRKGEADLLGLLDAEVKKLPKPRKPNL